MPLGNDAGILVVRRFAGYRDEPWRRYHYPTALYGSRIRDLAGSIVLLYEPRRGGAAPDSPAGGRQAFVGYAFLGDSVQDPDDPHHSYAELRHACEFPAPVTRRDTPVKQVTVRSAVSRIPLAVAEAILRTALSPVLQPSGTVGEGLIDTAVPAELRKREIRDLLTSRLVRDRTFRLRVVRDAYDGRCAITGLRLINGKGRAEVDAAHIRPVEADGPDIVQNGLALTRTMHWAFDRGLVSLSDDGRILTVERGLDDAARRLLPPDRKAGLPIAPSHRPHPAFLDWHRANVFKGVA